MNSNAPITPWNFLEGNDPPSPKALDATATQVQQNSKNSFFQTLTNSSDIVYSELPKPYMKGDNIAVKIPEDEYQAGLQACKNHLHGRVILLKGDSPLKFVDLQTKLSFLWNMIGKWGMISLGKGYYEFAFALAEDMKRVCSVGSWNLKPGFLKMFLWTPDFIPREQLLSHAQCWIKIHGLPQEYWRPRVIFSIAGGIGTPIALHDATKNRSFGYFAKVLVEIDLKGSLPEKILVKREGFAFYVPIEYENVPSFCNVCQTIGHISSNCRKIELKISARNMTKAPAMVERVNETPMISNLVINLKIDKEAASNMVGVENKELQSRIELESDGASDPFIVQQIGGLDNPAVVNDMRIIGKLWVDEDDQEESFTSVLSKSQKKRLKKKGTQGRSHFIQRGGYSNMNQ